MDKRLGYSIAIGVMALATSCSDSKKNEVAPAGPTLVGTDAAAAAADGSTLKVTAPTLVSPADGTTLTPESLGTDTRVTVRIQSASGTFVPAEPLNYYFQLLDASGNLLRSNTGTALTSVFTDLELNKTYRWRVRAEKGTAVGPSSPTWSFMTPDVPTGYIRGSELYDPLTEGKTVGVVHGSVTFIPGVGARLNSLDSSIEYALPVTLTGGEYSALITNLSTEGGDEDPKTRVMSMREGSAAINDNHYRMTVDKRNNGVVAWRFLSGSQSDFISAGPAERILIPFHEDQTYFYKATWFSNRFIVQVREGGFSGKAVYSANVSFARTYEPFPHMVYAGSPYAAGDRGEPLTVPGMTIRQIWVSANPRPAFANK